jgi:hypothetical protein
MTENMQLLSFQTWLILIDMIIPSATNLPENNIISLLFMVEYYSIVYIYYIFLIQPSIVGYLSCFQSLTIMNSDAVGMQVWWQNFS